jgi:hypothetical protein
MPEPASRTPIATAPLSVLLLCHGDAPLGEVLPGWLATLDGLGRDYEVLLADATSAQPPAGTTEQPEQGHPRVRHLSDLTGTGPGAALRAGLLAASYPLFVYADATPSYHAEDLQRLLEVIDQVDLVSGYRVPESRRDRPAWNEHVYRWLMRLVFGVRLKDVDCAFKLFRREIFPRIPIQTDGELVHAEVIAKANFLGCLMTEVPVRYRAPAVAVSGRPILRARWREAVRLFRHPDFGPPVLPTVSEQPVQEPPALETPLAGEARDALEGPVLPASDAAAGSPPSESEGPAVSG